MKIDHRVYHFLGGVLAIGSNRIRLVFPKKGFLYPEISLRNPYQIQAGMMIPRSYESSIVTSVASATYLSISISYFKSQSPLFSIFWLVTLPSFLLASLVEGEDFGISSLDVARCWHHPGEAREEYKSWPLLRRSPEASALAAAKSTGCVKSTVGGSA